MPDRHQARQQRERPTRVGDGAVAAEVESLRQQREVSRLKAGHGAEKFTEPRLIRVERFEHRLAGSLDLVLGLAFSTPRRVVQTPSGSDISGMPHVRGSPPRKARFSGVL